MNQLTEVVKNLLIINVIVFFGTSALPEHIKGMGAMYFPLSDSFQPYQIVTNMFMHADFQHLLFNMLSLFFLGPMVERAIGAKRFLILYFTAGFAAVLLHMGIKWWEYQSAIDLISPEQLALVKSEGTNIFNQGKNYIGDMGYVNAILNRGVLGASGSVYGVLLAFASLFPNMRLMLLFPPIPVAAKWLALGLVLIGLFSGVTGYNAGIAHWGHLGGAIAGFLLIRYWGMSKLF